ncbi:MAG: choice-of-anchor D domain-containing protein, partial [Roseimicrobium sp.]
TVVGNTLSVSSEGTFVFERVVPGMVPEIVVEQPSGVQIANGASRDFGTAPLATTVTDYDFSGALASHFTQVVVSPDASATQTGGVLKLSTTASPAEAEAIFAHNAFQPRFDQSWTAEIQIGLPASITNLPPQIGDAYIDPGLTVTFVRGDGTRFSLSSLLGMGDTSYRRYNGEASFTPPGGNWTEVHNEEGQRATTDATGTLRLTFDASTKILKAENSHETLLSLNLGGADSWGMSASDRFTLFLGLGANEWEVPQATPVTIDNFHATVLASSPVTKTFTVTNNGTGVLTGLNVTKNGSGAGDFSIGSLSTDELDPGQSTTFTVSFIPSVAGARSATLHLASNDLDENPFDIGVTGNELTVADNWRLAWFGASSNTGNAADAFDFDKDGLLNLAEFALNLNPTTQSTLPAAGARNGNVFEFTYTRSIAAVNAGVQFAVEWSDALAVGSWSTAGVTETILSDNGTTQQVKASIPVGSATSKFARLSLTAPQ